jgi:hypothetical protein
MSVKAIIPSIDSNNKKMSPNNVQTPMVAQYAKLSTSEPTTTVSFTGAGGFNPIVSLMDFIDAGGYAAAFIIQDGIGFIAPRVGKGLLRGGEEKKDENGNVILDKNGEPVRNLNWAYARKEGIREIVTGPSAFLIPMAMLHFINKYGGSGNNVKLNYIDGFQKPFTEFVKGNLSEVVAGTAPKQTFYQNVFEDVITRSVNGQLVDEAEKMSADEIKRMASEFAEKQLKVEAIHADKTLKKKERAAKLAEIGSVEDDFMKLMKNRVGGTVNEMAAHYSASNGTVKGGGIGELLKAMKDYFSDAAGNAKKVLTEGVSADQVESVVKSFTNRRMGSRVLTNLGIFGTVALFYTQIPKLYNMGLKGNPALGNNVEVQADKPEEKGSKKDVSFTGMGTVLEKTGKNFFNGKIGKGISDMFELNGPIISGTAMPVLLYGFCIPPRLFQAQDKYDYQEIMVRDMTAFTALLFGAKAIARLFSDGFTKLTGLALNSKNLEGRNIFQKTIDYLNPNDTRHSVLSSKQLDSKYTNIHEYKNGVAGFMEFIEGSGGNVKKAFSRDKGVKAAVEEIVQKFSGKSFAEATEAEIKTALKAADSAKGDLIENFYKLFKGDNGLLRAAKTCNSTFGFLSTLILVPGLIIWLTDVCQKMTEKRLAEETAAKQNAQPVAVPVMATNAPSMAGFIAQGVR